MTQVGCAGILVSDTFCGPMAGLPQEGQLLAVSEMPNKAGGCAANVAIDLAKQNITVDIAGCLGDDPSARVLLAGLEAHQVGCDRIVYSRSLPTSKTVILLVSGQDRRYIHSFGANAAFTVGDINRDWVQSLKVFYLGGLFLMPAFRLDEFVELLQFCRSQGITTVVDVVIPHKTILPRDLRPLLQAVDYILPNDDEAHAMTGETEPMAQLHKLAAWGANTVRITLAKRGVVAAQGDRCWQAGIYPMTGSVDPSGSGDAFAAGVVTGIVRQWDLPRTIQYASALGASATRALGTTDGVFTGGEAEAFITHHTLSIQSGPLSPKSHKEQKDES